MNPIISRAEWGARFGAGFGPAPLPAREVWLHHSAGGAPDLVAPFGDDDAAIRALERIGQDRFGGGISYTFLITPVGRIYEGHGIAREGAHTKGHNSVARSVCLVGNYEIIQPTGMQLDAVAWLLQHGEAQGWWVDAALNGGHRDVPGAQTACPGRFAHALVAEMNRRARGANADWPPTLTFGMRNHSEVARLQAWLRPRFAYAANLPPTGNYLDQTVAVIAEFQRRTGIFGPDADGRTIGPRTWGQLISRGFGPP